MVQMKAAATERVSSVMYSQLLLHTTSSLPLSFTYPSSHKFTNSHCCNCNL